MKLRRYGAAAFPTENGAHSFAYREASISLGQMPVQKLRHVPHISLRGWPIRITGQEREVCPILAGCSSETNPSKKGANDHEFNYILMQRKISACTRGRSLHRAGGLLHQTVSVSLLFQFEAVLLRKHTIVVLFEHDISGATAHADWQERSRGERQYGGPALPGIAECGQTRS